MLTKLKIQSYLCSTAFDLLINSNKLVHTQYKFKHSILINSEDLEEADKILRSNSIKYQLSSFSSVRK